METKIEVAVLIFLLMIARIRSRYLFTGLSCAFISPAVYQLPMVDAHSPFGTKKGACKLMCPIQAMNQNVIVDKLWIVLCLKSDKVNIRGLIMCSEGGVASNEMQQYFNRVYIQLFYKSIITNTKVY